MSRQLDNYLRDVEHHLRSLPSPIRNDEIREISAHLQQLIEEFIAAGHDEDEATALAIARFGSARRVGIRLRDVWEGNQSLLMVLVGWLAWEKICIGLGLWQVFSMFYQPPWLITLHFANGWMLFSPIGAVAIPFIVGTVFGVWGGRRAVIPIMLVFGSYVLSSIVFRTGWFSFSLSTFIGLMPLLIPALGAWCGAALKRSWRFSRVPKPMQC